MYLNFIYIFIVCQDVINIFNKDINIINCLINNSKKLKTRLSLAGWSLPIIKQLPTITLYTEFCIPDKKFYARKQNCRILGRSIFSLWLPKQSLQFIPQGAINSAFIGISYLTKIFLLI